MLEIFPPLVYALCFLTSSGCAWLLARSYRKTQTPLLLWSSVCFFLLAANNLIVIVDILIVPAFDLRFYRLLLSLAAVAVLLFGFIWDTEKGAE